jgi:hypothetical protein
MPAFFHVRATIMWWIPIALANRRVLQCVDPSVGFLWVYAKMRASIRGVRT